MPGALLPERPTPAPFRSARPAPVSGKLVVFAVLAIGLTLVLGVGTFAALTRPPRAARAPSAAGSASAEASGAAARPAAGMGW